MPLSVIFEVSFASSELPDIWKLADVVALYKKGNSSDPGNYRPVSLTCVACRIMELCIYDTLLLYLRQQNLLSRQQHGFLSKRSTCTQLIECFYDWTVAIDDKKSLDVVYIDFSKAFDTVCRAKLLLKLKSYGVDGLLYGWIESFLSNRRQRVVIGSVFSDYANVTSGVPQGSILGPLLFVLFVNDLPDELPGVITKLFADDVKLDHEIVADVQNALDLLCVWSRKWQLQIAVQKCCVLHVGSNNANSEYFINNSVLPSETCVRDLGVAVHCSLKSTQHCREIARKANRITNMLFRCFCTKDKNVLLKAYKTYVRPLVEYCTPVWNPSLVGDIDSALFYKTTFCKV